MARIDARAQGFSLLTSPLPQAVFVGIVLVLEVLGITRRIDNLRLAYAVGMTLVFVGMYLLARRRGMTFPAWVAVVLFVYVAVELLLPTFRFYDSTPLVNRFEHFTGFAVLTLFVLLFARMMLRQVFSMRGLLLIFALVWGVGLANEIIEYILYRFYRLDNFLDRDTLIDLAMNTAAITMVLLLAPRFMPAPSEH